MHGSTDTPDTFNSYRSLLFSIAYRMLGSVADAEDMVQETYLRWERASEDEVRSPKAYLSTVVTRLSIDQLRKQKAQREVYIGAWLPEPLMTEQTPALSSTAELAESLSLAFLLLLEALGPVERAVFLLREVFDYEYAEIAEIVGKSEANCRQMVRRARQHLRERRPRFPVSREHQLKMTERFIEACEKGDMEGLVGLLTSDIILISDGGGKTQAALKPIYGVDKVVRFFFAVLAKLSNGPALRVVVEEINGQVGVIAYLDGVPNTVVTFDYNGERISAINIVLNPDKMRGLRN